MPRVVTIGFCLLSLLQTRAQLPSIHALSVKPTVGFDLVPGNAPPRNFLYGLHLRYDRDLSANHAPWVDLLNVRGVSLGVLWNNLSLLKEMAGGQAYGHGMALGVLSEVDFLLAEAGKMNVLLTPGVGLTYITETIHTQPATSTVGSHLNLALSATLGLEFPVSERTLLVLGANVLHYSNGGLKIPNRGINTVNGTLGVKTALGHTQPTPRQKPPFPSLPGSSAELSVGAGRRGKYRSAGGFWRTGIYAGYNYYFNDAIGVKAGLDAVYYHQVFDGNFETTFQYYGSSYDNIRLGTSAGMEVALGRFAVNALFGRYLHYRSYHGIQWYWTSALRYYLTPHIALQSTLYMHRVQADYLNWGLVFRK